MAFLGLWRPFGTVVGSILESFLGAFWLPNRAVDRIAKTTKSDEIQHFLRFVQVPGGRKSTKNVTESRFEHQPCSKSVSGASWDQFWSNFGSILGSKICSKRKLNIEAILSDFEGPNGEGWLQGGCPSESKLRLDVGYKRR